MFNDAVQVQYLFKAGKPEGRIWSIPHQSLDAIQGTRCLSATSCLRMSGEPDGAEFIRFSYSRLPGMKRFKIVLKRYLEKIVLASYKRTCRKQGRIFLYKEDKDAD